jgi:hypothetical protein
MARASESLRRLTLIHGIGGLSVRCLSMVAHASSDMLLAVSLRFGA